MSIPILNTIKSLFAPTKGTPIGADSALISDSEDSAKIKKTLLSNFPVSTAQASADATVLSTSEAYTDASISTEVTNRNNAISNAIAGQKYKELPCRLKTTANITLSGLQTIDSISGIAEDSILVGDQTDPKENGAYLMKSGSWVRRTDSDTGSELEGAIYQVTEGVVYANTSWRQTTDGVTIGVSNIIFLSFGAQAPVQSVNGQTGVITGLEQTSNKEASGGYAGLTLFKINFRNVANSFTSFFTNSNTAARTYTFQDRNGIIADDTDLGLKVSKSSVPWSQQLSCSDLSSTLTTGTAKAYFRPPYGVTLTSVRASLLVAQTLGAILTIDINEAGSTILSTKLTIDNTELTSITAATAPVISDPNLADDSFITIDIDQIGDGTAKGLIVTLIGTISI